MSALRRAFSVSGRTPWLSSDLVSWSGVEPHPRAHPRIGLIDIAGGRIDAEFLGFLDLHLFVDQFVDHFLPRHLLARGQEVELGALLDIVDW